MSRGESEGGMRKWLCFGAAFMLMAIGPGFLNSMGNLFNDIISTFTVSRTEAALVGTAALASSRLSGLINGSLVQTFGLKVVCTLAGLLGTLGLAASIFATGVDILVFGTGIFQGYAASAMHMTSAAIVAQEFSGNLGLALLSVVNCGAGLGGIAFPYVISYLVQEFGLRGSLLLIGGFFLHAVPVALLSKKKRDVKSRELCARAKRQFKNTSSVFIVSASENKQLDCKYVNCLSSSDDERSASNDVIAMPKLNDTRHHSVTCISNLPERKNMEITIDINENGEFIQRLSKHATNGVMRHDSTENQLIKTERIYSETDNNGCANSDNSNVFKHQQNSEDFAFYKTRCSPHDSVKNTGNSPRLPRNSKNSNLQVTCKCSLNKLNSNACSCVKKTVEIQTETKRSSRKSGDVDRFVDNFISETISEAYNDYKQEYLKLTVIKPRLLENKDELINTDVTEYDSEAKTKLKMKDSMSNGGRRPRLESVLQRKNLEIIILPNEVQKSETNSLNNHATLHDSSKINSSVRFQPHTVSSEKDKELVISMEKQANIFRRMSQSIQLERLQQTSLVQRICDVVRTPSLTLFILGTAVGFTSLLVLLVYIEDIFTEYGLAEDDATLVLAIISGLGIVGRLLPGILMQSKHVQCLWVSVAGSLICLGATAAMMTVKIQIVKMTLFSLSGIGFGIFSSTCSVTLVVLAGVEKFPILMGILGAVSGIGNVVAGPVFGWMRTVSGSYTFPLSVCMVSQVVAAVMFLVADWFDKRSRVMITKF